MSETRREDPDPPAMPAAEDRLARLEEELAEARRTNRRLRAKLQDPAASAEVLSLRSQMRELASDLNRTLQYLGTTREHVESLFASRRWRIGGALVDRYLWLRRRERPETAEDHLRSLFRDLDGWQGRRRPFQPPGGPSGAPRPARRAPARPKADRRKTSFYRHVEGVVGSSPESAFARAFAASERALASYRMADDGPLVSVIMPTLDRADIIGEAIGSVLDQTYESWELIVSDDGSTDGTGDLVAGYSDPRIRYLADDHAGAAAARNRALREARGELVAYLDTDNVWHPDYLAAMVAHLEDHPGHYCAYCWPVDVAVKGDGYRVKRFSFPEYDYETLAEKNFIDLNGFLHRRELYDALGGFDERLVRQQDWYLVLKYCFLRDPAPLDAFLVLYRRNPDWDQITIREHGNTETVELILGEEDKRHRRGLTVAVRTPRPSVSVVSWDICRNHFSKAYNLAEALSRDRDVELVGFRFFEEEIFPPYAEEKPSFPTKYFGGADFPDLHRELTRALAALEGDVVYAVKPRLPSMGLGLLANFHFGKPLVVEINDLESVVANPGLDGSVGRATLDEADPGDPRLLSPYHQLWSRMMESLAPELPALVTHNANLDRHFASKSYQIRNLKDEEVYDPERYSRSAIRRRLGLADDDRVLLFGGMVRRHKGIFPLVDFVEQLGDERYQLLVASSRPTPDEARLAERGSARVRLLPPQGRNAMAEINLAADAVVLWLDPATPASHYQMPYKLTDAMAMGVPVIANPISDLALLGQAGYLRLVDYGDFEELGRAVEETFADPGARRETVRRARRLYLRQFSYGAARANAELILSRVSGAGACLPAAERFVDFFARFYEATRVAQPVLEQK